MTVAEMNRRRIERGYSCRELADLTGVPAGTIRKVFGGITKRPRRETLLKLERILGKPDSEMTGSAAPAGGAAPGTLTASGRSGDSGTMEVREPAEAYRVPLPDDRFRDREAEERERWPQHHYSRQGQYTLEDYYALPEDQRVELIDGVFYDMGAPASPHQLIGGSVYSQLAAFRNANKGPCLPMMSPVDVQLDRDNRTVVQPDVLVVCDRSKITYQGIYGAPDFIVEVLSPSTRKKDMTLKLAKYIEAGVREYWQIDPRTRQIVVHDLENGGIPAIYTFQDRVPVGIWEGKCCIVFSDVAELMDELFPEA